METETTTTTTTPVVGATPAPVPLVSNPSLRFYGHASLPFRAGLRPEAPYLDAALDLYEALHYERLPPPQLEARLSALHARLFDLSTPTGMLRDAAALSLLPLLLALEPRLEPLMRATLGRVLEYRCGTLGAECVRYDKTALYPRIEEGPPCEAEQFAEWRDRLIALLHRVLEEVPHEERLAEIQRHVESIVDARERARSCADSSKKTDTRFFLVQATRDGYDVWAAAAAGNTVAGGRNSSTAVRGRVWLHAGELPLALVRRAQHHVAGETRRLRARYGLVAHLSELVQALSARDVGAELHAASMRHVQRLNEVPTARSMAAWRRPAELAALVRASAPFYDEPLVSRMLRPLAQRTLARLDLVYKAAARRHAAPSVAPPAGVESTLDSLLLHIYDSMPPCHARLFLSFIGERTTADMFGNVATPRASHPRFHDRIRAAMFLLYGGWTLDRAMHVWRFLFAADGACAHAASGQETFEVHSKYARDLEGLHALYRKSIEGAERAAVASDLATAKTAEAKKEDTDGDETARGPASCRTLCAQGACPMVEADGASVSASKRASLAVEFSYVPDIEDVVSAAPSRSLDEVGAKSRAQARCTRFYRAVHPNRVGDAHPVAHPNAYYERALGYWKSVKQQQ